MGLRADIPSTYAASGNNSAAEGFNHYAHLYLRGSCFRISSTVEMAYSPVSSVSSSTSEALPEPDTAAKACMQGSS